MIIMNCLRIDFQKHGYETFLDNIRDILKKFKAKKVVNHFVFFLKEIYLRQMTLERRGRQGYFDQEKIKQRKCKSTLIKVNSPIVDINVQESVE